MEEVGSEKRELLSKYEELMLKMIKSEDKQ